MRNSGRSRGRISAAFFRSRSDDFDLWMILALLHGRDLSVGLSSSPGDHLAKLVRHRSVFGMGSRAVVERYIICRTQTRPVPRVGGVSPLLQPQSICQLKIVTPQYQWEIHLA